MTETTVTTIDTSIIDANTTSAKTVISKKPSKTSKNTKSNHPSALTPSIVQKLCAPVARKLGVKELYLFGSVAKGTANQNSDVDFIYEMQNDSSIDCETAYIVSKKQMLTEALSKCLGRKIDLVNKRYVTQPLVNEDAELQRKAFVTEINTQPIFQIV